MTAAKVVRTLLANSAALTAVVPAARIECGVLPEGTAVPAISVLEVSASELPAIGAAAGAVTLCEARIQVTALCANYRQVKDVLALVRKAANYQRGTVASVSVVSVRRLANGPDFLSDEGLCIQSMDFAVTYYEAN